MKLPLEGFRVLDWTVWQAGPGAGMILGDLGADVIKIEDRTTGDPSRGMEQGTGVTSGGVTRQAYFESNNRNKRGMVLDLRKAKARDIVYQLAAKSDVFITNFRESVVTRYGMDYDALCKHNPRIVYGLISGNGTKGPETEVRSYDALGQARSGIMLASHPDQPLYVLGGIGDGEAGIMCAFGVTVALLARERQGIGQKVETSLLSSLLFQQWVGLGFTYIGGHSIYPMSRTQTMNPLALGYKCGDGQWLYMMHPEADRFWPNICKAMGLQHLQHDPKFDNIQHRRQNCEEFVRMMDGIFATKSRDEWIRVLRENDCVVERVNRFEDIVKDPQVIANNYLPEFDHPIHGKTRYAPIPFEFSKTPGALRRPAPEFGQHTEEILTETLGYNWDQISELKNAQVI